MAQPVLDDALWSLIEPQLPPSVARPKLDFIHSCSIANDIDKAFDDCRCWFLPVWVWS